MSEITLYSDTSTGKLTTRDGGNVTLRDFVLGDTVVFKLHPLDRFDDTFREARVNVRSLRASFGKALEPPASGAFSLIYASTASDSIATGATHETFLDAVSAWSIVDQVTRPAPSTWIARTTLAASGSPPVIVELANALDPVSFVRIRRYSKLGVWWFECRLIVAPLAWNEDGHDRVLADPPTVTRVYEGRAATDTADGLNELQKLHLPRDFRGTYFLRWNFRVSRLLGTQDGPDEIAAALHAMFTTPGERFLVTNLEPDYAHIEFVGPLGFAPQPEITVQVESFEPGTLTFTVPLIREELCAALRAVPDITAPFEVEIEVVDDDQDAGNPAIPGRILTLFQTPVKILREGIWDEIASIQRTDWLRPRPRNYLTFTPDQIITGQQSYIQVFGNGAAHEFSLPHNLNPDNEPDFAINNLAVYEITGVGRLLTPNADFSADLGDSNVAVLTFASPPAANSLLAVITATGPRSAFQAHTHSIAQIVGLQDVLDALGARLGVIEERLPFTSPSITLAGDKATEIIALADKYFMFPGWFPDGTNFKDAKPPNRPGALLPAIHDATVDNLTVPLVSASGQAGKVFRNVSGAAVQVPGGLGGRGHSLPHNGYLGSDGRIWYVLSRDGATNSFYPQDFEREFFIFPMNDKRMRPGDSMKIEFDLELALLKATSRAQYMLVIEVGDFPQQNTPAPVGINLSDVNWNTTPMLAQRIILSDVRQKHKFGVAIQRSILNAISADVALYGVWEAATVAPTSANFALRARLRQFDTENSVANARGAVAIGFTHAEATLTHA